MRTPCRPTAPPPPPRRSRGAPRTSRCAARSSPAGARLARAEEPDERLDDAAVGVDGDLVDRQAAQQAPSHRQFLLDGGGELRAHLWIARVDVDRRAGLR